MLHRDIFAVSYEIYMKQINVLCGHNVEFLTGGT
jgi:hypothetical protein